VEDLSSVSNAEVIAIPTGDGRRRRLEAARRGREPSRASDRGAGAGRAWLNGREVGGPARRYAHLGRVHD